MNWNLRYSEIGRFKPIQHGANTSRSEKLRCAEERRQNGLSGQCEKCMVRTKSTETIEHGPNTSKSQKERCRQERKSMGEPGLCDECSIGNKTRNEIQNNGEVHRVSYSPNGKETSRSRIEADGTKSFWEGQVSGKNGRSNNLKIEAIKYWESQDNGKHVCQICGQSPQEKYGNESNLKRFPMHHLNPLNTYPKGGGFTNVKDLIPACRSCHEEVLHELGTHNEATTLENAKNRFQQHKQIKMQKNKEHLDDYKNNKIDENEFLKKISAKRSKAKVMPAIETYDDLTNHLKLHHTYNTGGDAIPTDATSEFERQTGNYFAQTPEHEALREQLFRQQHFEIHEALHDTANGTPNISGPRADYGNNDWDQSKRISQQKTSHSHATSTNPNPVWDVAKWKEFRLKKNEAREVGVPKNEYGKLHRAGIPHEQIMDFAGNHPNESMAQYRKARRGETHENVMNFVNNGGNLRAFVTWAHFRGSHWGLNRETGEHTRLPNSLERYTNIQNQRKKKNELEA